MFLQWVFGMLFRPGDTYLRAREQLRFGYWWIVLSVFTLESIFEVYRVNPPLPLGISASEAVLNVIIVLLIYFDLQAVCLLGSARVFGWQITWAEAVKYAGLGWSFFLIQDLAFFSFNVRGDFDFLIWAGLPFSLWYLIALTAGIRRLANLTTLRALMVATVAFVPLEAALFWWNLSSLAAK